jgi:hypothetical protein
MSSAIFGLFHVANKFLDQVIEVMSFQARLFRLAFILVHSRFTFPITASLRLEGFYRSSAVALNLWGPS